MLQYIHVFGISINTYKLFFYIALATVPIVLFALRKTFGLTKEHTMILSGFTLAFGLVSAWLTGVLKQVMLGWASGGVYHDDEILRNYGIPIFLPLFLLLYCLIWRHDFRKLSDYLAPCVYSVMTFVKIGCTLWGCCYGEESAHGIWNEMLGTRTFPVQLLDAVTSALILIACLWMILKTELKGKGYIYPISGILFALTKGFWEFFRVHESVYERSYLGTGFTLWQYWLLVLLIGCIVWLVFLKRESPQSVVKAPARKGSKKKTTKR